ncbi:MAG TPA: M15 family metallopeptidase [Candidatus Saccharimonadales bacterium]|nr:M15 family metallopeptidase [Candidatus Saccharimonadales bacterium]
MTLLEQLQQSKQPNSQSSPKFPNQELADPLVALKSTKHLKIDPIWRTQIDEFEGGLYSAYIAKHPAYNALFVRPEVAKKLHSAAQSLSANWQLIVRAGHRPLEVQQNLLKSLQADFLEHNPEARPEEALAHARQYVSDPTIMTPPHCSGAAVDVDVLDIKTGKLVDFGCPMNTASEKAHLHSQEINQAQYANRLILLKAMLQAGFASNFNEWWHYSYGDYQWARFYSQERMLYGIIEPQL